MEGNRAPHEADEDQATTPTPDGEGNDGEDDRAADAASDGSPRAFAPTTLIGGAAPWAGTALDPDRDEESDPDDR
jgi:hypothetical protein